MLEGLDGFHRVEFGHGARCATMAVENWRLASLVESSFGTQV
jgi:hypothetical protein